VVEKEYELDVEYGTVYALVRYKLGAKLKYRVLKAINRSKS